MAAEPKINRAKMYQIFLMGFGNVASQTAYMFIGWYMFYSQNVLGLFAVVLGVIATSMRLLDGITDPVIGFIVDKTDVRFGKVRPYYAVGALLLILGIIGMFNCPLSFSTTAKYIFTTISYLLFIWGYTFFASAGSAGMVILTSDPKQRPIMLMITGFLTMIVYVFGTVLITSILAQRYELSTLDPALWRTASIYFSIIIAVATTLAIIGIWEKDRSEFFGTGDGSDKLKIKDVWPIIKKNQTSADARYRGLNRQDCTPGSRRISRLSFWQYFQGCSTSG